ncbi:hypothetical protein K505DRAFT_330670 [Melanomma pulvis-pyrius CBS 109.77]|uniref:Uncharacterized protein n=1 Tax=Melanomma pulvis-pyrius CBS 109.77 TaxID=1314802 RepID=A0A6A6WPE8_9PLEO|nr:hypothetical protein K505DRAFT_330670 [Melanomma pulvis-pyrius CBS 109.77]
MDGNRLMNNDFPHKSISMSSSPFSLSYPHTLRPTSDRTNPIVRKRTTNDSTERRTTTPDRNTTIQSSKNMAPTYRTAAFLIVALTSLVTGASAALHQDSTAAVEPTTLLTTRRLVTRESVADASAAPSQDSTAAVEPTTLLTTTTRRLVTRGSVDPRALPTSRHPVACASVVSRAATDPTVVIITKTEAKTEASNPMATPHTLAERDYTSGKFLVLEGTRTADLGDGRWGGKMGLRWGKGG